MLISWQQGVSGDFATASNWSPATVPGPGDDVLVGAKGTYTVTSSIDETADSLTIAQKNATLLINGASTFSDPFGGVNDGAIVINGSSKLFVTGINTTNTTLSTTLSNVGTIDLDNSSLLIGFSLGGSVTTFLTGGGDINLSGGTISGGSAFGTNVTVISDNTISGTGGINLSFGGQEAHGVWINQGVVDASTPNGTLSLSRAIIDNSSVLEATNGGLLDFIVAPLHNSAQGVVEAKGENSEVNLGFNLASGTDSNAGLIAAVHSGTVMFQDVFGLDNTNGTIEAGHGSTVALEDASIDGGFITILRGGLLESAPLESVPRAPSTITGAVIRNAGTIGAEGVNLTIGGDVTNTGTLDANNATLLIDGAVSGGRATLEGTGEIEFGGASAARVTFAANSSAMLKLDDPSTFTGTIFGLATGDSVDLTNINFADNPTLSYSNKTHVLTVTDSVSQVIDTISLKHVSGSFTAQSDGNGGTLITDPPLSNKVAVSHDRDAFAALAEILSQAHENGMYSVAHDAGDLMHAASLSAPSYPVLATHPYSTPIS
jgi:hypothetical protein